MIPRSLRLGLLLLTTIVGASSVDAQTTSRTIALNGIEMHVESHGEGEPLLLLHGFGMAGVIWSEMVPELGAGYRVIVPDLRGHGRSTNPSKQFTFRQSALDIMALMDSLGIERFKAIGISAGGMTLLHIATRDPSRIEAMVLVGAATYFPEQARVIMRGATVDRLRPSDYERGRMMHARGDEQTRELEAQFNGFKDSYDDVNFTQPFLSTITARTLIVHGDRDEFFPVEIPLEMYRGIPNSQLWIIPGGGHVPIIDPSVPFVATARGFLR